MNVQFAKMHGTRNSFIIIADLANLVTPHLATDSYRVINWCSREQGLGADGLILIQKSTQPTTHFKLLIYNAEDASLAEMCGNAVRCVSKYLYDTGYHRENRCAFDTPAGIIETELLQSGDKQATVRVNMGAPRFSSPDFIPQISPSAAPNRSSSNFPSNSPVPAVQSFHYEGYTGFFVSMGNPHAVIPVPHYDFNYRDLAAQLQQQSELFPNGVNVGFLNYLPVEDPTESGVAAELRVVERGVGETASCGTGACAATVILTYLPQWLAHLPASQQANAPSTNPHPQSPYRIRLTGGILSLNWQPPSTPPSSATQDSTPIFMTGAAVTIAHGTLKLAIPASDLD